MFVEVFVEGLVRFVDDVSQQGLRISACLMYFNEEPREHQDGTGGTGS